MSGRGLSLLLPFTLNLFLSLIFMDHKASILRLLKPGLGILFESGPIRTQVCFCTEQAGKQTNKQTTQHFHEINQVIFVSCKGAFIITLVGDGLGKRGKWSKSFGYL